MPSIRGIPGPYRFFFYSFGCQEPRHVPVEGEDSACMFWLEPLILASNFGFSPKELNRIRSMIQLHRQPLTEAWNDHFGPR